MQDLITAIKAWPIIIQGALGSALFWLILLAGQKLSIFISDQYSHKTKKTRKNWLINERAKCLADTATNDSDFSIYAVIIIYRASRQFTRALIWLSAGLLLNSTFIGFGFIGYFGCIFYLMRVLTIVGPFNRESYPNNAIEAIESELNTLKGV